MSTTAEEIKDGAEENAEEEIKKIDFKMVTFSLAGRSYGINIMKVKEIAKANRFTFIPNTPPFIQGVYNLRGEIISIINLRKMFHLDAKETEKGKLENIIIIRTEDHMIGMIVDSVNNVIGIDSDTIQPRHPIFADINMKYISGIVEVEGNLYIILDIDLILVGKKEAAKETTIAEIAKEVPVKEKKKKPIKKIRDQEQLSFEFIKETLATFKNFYITALNKEWAENRYIQWGKLRKKQGKELQLANIADADEFLESFYSASKQTLWEKEYKKYFEEFVKTAKDSIKIWNPKCGKGYTSYSIAAILRLKYQKLRIKVWACDNNLLDVSTAPNMIFPANDVPDYLIKEQMVKKIENGFQFKKEIRDLILFEYHDISHGTELPELDIILAYDVLSFYNPENQEILIKDFKEKLKNKGILIIGKNEKISDKGWHELKSGNIIAYQNKKE